MDEYKKEFISFMVRSGVLTFGNFTTKSGRKTPFFINTGNYDNGRQMSKLGRFYAETIQKNIPSMEIHLFGPAYKGIPLVVTTAISLCDHHDRNVSFSFNRKEIKDHGEGGGIVGYQFKANDNVVIVEDVTTSGASIRETVPILRKMADINLKALIVSVDRMEKGTGKISALDEIRQEFGLEVYPIVTLEEIVEFLSKTPIDGKIVLTNDLLGAIKDYRQIYGA
jgi:orotate phosphoribosyltransferase